MSSGTLADPRVVPNPTLEQLDELESLIQRMLEIPVVQVPEPILAAQPALPRLDAAHAPAPGGFDYRDRSSAAPGHSCADQEPSQSALMAPPRLEARSRPDTHTAADPDRASAAAVNTAARPIIARRSLTHSNRRRAAAQPASGRKLILWPLASVNWIFDLYTFPLGPFGRWLRESSGRALLGGLGVVSLVAACAWALGEWMGWIS
jgi:hypothetical protein